MVYTILPRYENGVSPNYILIAEQERLRQWNIAKEHMKNPTLPNVLNAISAAWKGLPFNTTASTVNPNMHYGTAPDIGAGPSRMLSTAEKLSAAAKIQQAKGLVVRRAKAAAKKAAEERLYYEAFAPARAGISTEQPISSKVPYSYRYGYPNLKINNTLSPSLKVTNTAENYVANEAERAAAIDFLTENPEMRRMIDTDVVNKYASDDYMYPWTAYFKKLLPSRKSLKQTRLELDRTLRNIP